MQYVFGPVPSRRLGQSLGIDPVPLKTCKLPSLDAGNAKLYRQINRPHPEVSSKRLVDGLITFRGQYRGKLWVEVMLVQGFNYPEQKTKS